jgi:pseudouridine synthase
MSKEKPTSEGERLQKVLAAAGIASRRASEELIRQGRVSVDGVLVREPGVKVVPSQKVRVDGKQISAREQNVYMLLHKPRGLVSTAAVTHGRPTVVEAVEATERVYPVGRLDQDSEGLVLLTNDGELAFRMTHPSYGVEKVYKVLVLGNPGDEKLERLRRGIEIEGKVTATARVRRIEREAGQKHDTTWLEFTIHEGRKRQIRLMTEAVGHPTLRLIRIKLGPLDLGTLKAGEKRLLRPAEVRSLRVAVGLKS